MRGLRFVVFAAALGLARAHGTAPRLDAIDPPGGQVNSKLELSFSGDRLEDAQEIIVSEPGFNIARFNSIEKHKVKAEVIISPECDLGEHHFRLRTESGLSELRTFIVGPLPVAPEAEPNNSREKAQRVDLNTTVQGGLVNDDEDWFVFQAKKGEVISIEVEAMRLGRSDTDARLEIYAPDNRLVAKADDTWLGVQDPCISLVTPAEGAYSVRLREVTYGGTDKSRYRLSIGTFVRPTAVFPLGGQTNETLAFSFYNPASGIFTQTMVLPKNVLEYHGLFPDFNHSKPPTPNWVRVSAFPNFLAHGFPTNRERASVCMTEPPVALNGILSEPHQENWFSIPVRKGESYQLEAFARRLHSPVDTVIEVLSPDGRTKTSNDDFRGADSRVEFKASETTNYFVLVRDQLGRGGPDYGYRIEVVHPEPAIDVKIPEVARNDTQSRQFIAVPRGNRFATLISAKRANLSGELHFRTSELPAGMSMLEARMPANLDSMPLFFEAAADAPIGGKLIDLTACATNSGREVEGRFHQRVELVQGPNNTTYYLTTVDKLCVAVVKEVPFKLKVVPPKIPLVRNGSMRLEVIAERDPEFDEAIEVKMVWNPPGVSSQPELTIAKGATNGFYQLNANSGAEARVWSLALLGNASVNGGKTYVSSPPVSLEVATPFVSGKMETTWASPGSTARLTVNLTHDKPFSGKGHLKLAGLPANVSADERDFSDRDQQVVFELKIAKDCAFGSTKTLFCSAEIPVEGQMISHTIAQSGILRIVPPKTEKPGLMAQQKK